MIVSIREKQIFHKKQISSRSKNIYNFFYCNFFVTLLLYTLLSYASLLDAAARSGSVSFATPLGDGAAHRLERNEECDRAVRSNASLNAK